MGEVGIDGSLHILASRRSITAFLTSPGEFFEAFLRPLDQSHDLLTVDLLIFGSFVLQGPQIYPYYDCSFPLVVCSYAGF